MREISDASIPPRPALPQPHRERWQPLRLGLVEVFHYDSEEFWFHDGHLLLRGNNGTGKSKVLSLTLPFLFDAQLRPSRIEPDGDNSKRMAWNLLMNSYPRRIGYTWIEFGRRTHDGGARFLTLGAGLSAVDGKTQVDSWYFILEGGAEEEEGTRIGQDLWLTNAQRVVLTRDRLREVIEDQGRGQVFEHGHGYRRAVDERLFHLGVKRYEALMDTLIQLRQPQLSKKPDEAGLSHALTEALPPMPAELLADVAEALNQLEEDRNRLDEMRQLEHAVKHFEQRYRVYAGMLTRRQARELRQAQTAFDNASEERNKAQFELERARNAEAETSIAHDSAKQLLITARERLETLQSDPANQDANRLSQAEKDAEDAKSAAASIARQCDESRQKLTREEERSRRSSQRADTARSELLSARTQCAADAEASGTAATLETNPLTAVVPDELATLSASRLASAADELREAASKRRQDIRHLEQRQAAAEKKQSALESLQFTQRERHAELEEAMEQRAAADQNAELAGINLIDAWVAHSARLVQLRFDDTEPLQQLAAWAAQPQGPNPADTALSEAYRQASLRHANRQSELDLQQTTIRQQHAALVDEKDRLTAGHDAFPPTSATRAPGVRDRRAGAPLWQLVDFQPHVEADERAGIEAALEASGLLDAWLAPDGALTTADGTALLDSHWAQRSSVHTANLTNVLSPAVPDGNAVATELVATLLAGVAYGQSDVTSAESWMAADGRYRLGALAGAWHKQEAVYIGHTARARARQRRLEEIARLIDELDGAAAAIEQRLTDLRGDRERSEQELRAAPSDIALREAVIAAAGAGQEVARARQRLDQIEVQCRAAEEALETARETVLRDAIDLQLPSDPARLSSVSGAVERFSTSQLQLLSAAREWHNAWPDYLAQQERETEARDALAQTEAARINANERAEKARTRYDTLPTPSARKSRSCGNSSLPRARQYVQPTKTSRTGSRICGIGASNAPSPTPGPWRRKSTWHNAPRLAARRSKNCSASPKAA